MELLLKSNYIDGVNIHNELVRLHYKFLYTDSNYEENKIIKYNEHDLANYIPKETFYLVKKEKISYNKFCFLIDKYLYELKCNGLIDYYEITQREENDYIAIKYKCV